MSDNLDFGSLDLLELTQMGFFDVMNDDSKEKSELEQQIQSEMCVSVNDIKVKNANQPTFVEVDDGAKENFVKNMRNTNTVRKTETSIRQFQRWLSAPPRNVIREVSDIPVSELDNHIGSFLLSIRKADGSEYEPDTLTSYHRGIDRYLREKNYPYSMVQDKEFSTSRSVLASKRKFLKEMGKGNKPNAAEPLSHSEEQALKENKCVGSGSPQQLMNKMWLTNTMLFGLRGGTENHKLRWGDISLRKDEKDNEFLEFNERATKTRTGETAGSSVRAFRPKQYAHKTSDDCPVQAYKEFAKRRPKSECHPEAPFYWAINHNRRKDAEVWYKSQPLGENSLRSIMKNMAAQANLPGKKTNHTARKTTCTKLLHAGVAPTTIQQLTDHKNVQSVNNYATASNEMQRHMSDILSDNVNVEVNKNTSLEIQRPAESLPTGTEIQIRRPMTMASGQTANWNNSSSLAQSGQILQSANLYNCQIAIHNTFASTSPQPKRRRISTMTVNKLTGSYCGLTSNTVIIK